MRHWITSFQLVSDRLFIARPRRFGRGCGIRRWRHSCGAAGTPRRWAVFPAQGRVDAKANTPAEMDARLRADAQTWAQVIARGGSRSIEAATSPEENAMSNGSPLSLAEIDERIRIVRDNIRQLIEQAAAMSGAEDEERNANRIAQQNDELERLNKQRDALVKKK